jgi:hypothetical protein
VNTLPLMTLIPRISADTNHELSSLLLPWLSVDG